MGRRSCSLPLQRIICDFAFECSFSKASERIQEHYGFKLPVSTVAQVARKQAAKIAKNQLKQHRSANVLPAHSEVDDVIAEADGSFIRIVSTRSRAADSRKTRTVQYREARLCAATAKGSQRIYYGATFDSVETVSQLWSQTAKLAGMSLESTVHVVCDGASWIDTQRTVAFGKQGKLLIDLYHVMEYLSDASESCSDNPKRWLHLQKKRLKTGHHARVIAELENHLEPSDQAEETSPVLRAWRYLNNRREHLAYDKALEKDLPLGSGLIESGNKHVLQSRLKIPGASWATETAENFAQVRAMRANQHWNAYWEEYKKAA